MSRQSDLVIFERAVESGGRLLRAEADRAGPQAGLLVLTFDVGRVLVSAGGPPAVGAEGTAAEATPAGPGLAVRVVPERSALPAGLISLEEEEPWWRLLGHPLTAVWPGDVESGVGARSLDSAKILKLRFREEAKNPRVVALEARGETVKVALEG